MPGRARRRLAYSALLALAAAIVFFLTVLPGMAERSLNRHTGLLLPQVSPEGAALHGDLSIADLHADSLLWNRDLLRRARRGHVDLPRLVEGNVALQVFAAVIKTPRGQNYRSNTAQTDALRPLLVAQLWPPSTWTGLEARATYQAERLHRFAERSAGRLTVVDSRSSLSTFLERRRTERQAVAGLLAIEGLQALEGDLDAIDRLYAAGYRMMGLAHFYDNKVAGSAHGVEKGGLTPLGRQVLERLESLAMIIDLAHASPAAIAAVLSSSTRPVVVSHTGVTATCPGGRNLSDDQIRGVAATGGVIGVGFWDGAVCDPSPTAVVDAMRHIAGLVGVAHVALGSDYDGATEVSFDSSQLAVLTDALLSAGFSSQEVRAIMGANAIRVLLEALPAT